MRSFLILTFTACAAQPTDTITPPTIQQGVFGQIINGCDTPDCKSTPSVGSFVDVFATTPTLGVVASGAESNTVSDQHGSYELALAAGSHVICIGDEPEGGGFVPRSCTTFSVTDQTVVRLDYAYGPSGGRWYTP